MALLSERINGRAYDSLESYALFILQQKWANNALTVEEQRLLIGDFLSDYLTLDPQTGEPVGDTLSIEQ